MTLGLKEYIIAGISALALLYIGYLNIVVAHRNGTISELTGQLQSLTTKYAQEQANTKQLAVLNSNNAEAATAAAGDADKRVALAVADRDRTIKELRNLNVAKVKINEAVAQCTMPNPPAYGAVDQWLRSNPGPSTHRRDRNKVRGETAPSRKLHMRGRTTPARRRRRCVRRGAAQAGCGPSWA